MFGIDLEAKFDWLRILWLRQQVLTKIAKRYENYLDVSTIGMIIYWYVNVMPVRYF